MNRITLSHCPFTHILLYFIAVLGLVSCVPFGTSDKHKAEVDTYPTIDLGQAVEAPVSPLNLSDFVEEIEYIRPEYPASLVDFILGMSINEDYLLLEVRDGLLCYTREGKFIREIGKKGHGPAEHLGIRSSALFNDCVAINSNYNRKILWYDTNGNYLKQSAVSNNVFKINILDTNRIVIHLQHGIPMGDPDLFVVGILDNNGDTIQLRKADPYYPEGLTTSPVIWEYNGTVRVLTCINDTVYSISENEITPAFVVNFGKQKVSQEAFADMRLLEEERWKYITNLTFYETTQNLFAMFQYNNNRWIAVYDKSAAKISAWSVKPKNVNKYGIVEGGGWVNDIDGGISPTYFHSVSGGYFALQVQPEELKNQFNDNKKAIIVRNPQKHEKLEKIINSLSEDENPIIVLYKLKSE